MNHKAAETLRMKTRFANMWVAQASDLSGSASRRMVGNAVSGATPETTREPRVLHDVLTARLPSNAGSN